LQNLPYFEGNLLKVTIFRHSIHGGQQWKEKFWKKCTMHLR
jgi:hypothetical protein